MHETERLTGGVVFYDGNCNFCKNFIEKVQPLLKRNSLAAHPSSSTEAQKALGLKPGETPGEMKVLTAEKKLLGGADAIMFIIGKSWWGYPLYLFSRLPGVHYLFKVGYRFVSKRRYCISGKCEIS